MSIQLYVYNFEFNKYFVIINLNNYLIINHNIMYIQKWKNEAPENYLRSVFGWL